MPELPEVESVRRSLLPHIKEKRICHVDVKRKEVIHTPKEDVAAFCSALQGKTVIDITRRGKYLFLCFKETDDLLSVHLRMTGKLLWFLKPEPWHIHRHVIFTLSDQSVLTYDDVRRFGGFSYLDQAAYQKLCGRLGPDGCDGDFHAKYLFSITRKRKTPIKELLLDQRKVAGLGNIYVDEILFASGIRPRKSAGRLSMKECERIVDATHRILKEAIALGGSSIRDYRNAEGKAGGFQRAHQVYGRANRPCLQCGSELKMVVVGGRSSVYCPQCQKS